MLHISTITEKQQQQQQQQKKHKLSGEIVLRKKNS